MVSCGMKKWMKKRGISFLLDLLLVIFSIGSAYFIKNSLKRVYENIQQIGTENIVQMQQAALTSNMTTLDPSVFSQISALSAQAKTIETVIPLLLIGFILIFFATQSINWKMLNNTPIMRFVILGIPFFFFSAWFGSLFLEMLLYLFAYWEFSWWPFVISGIFALVSSYFGLVGIAKWRTPFKKIFTLKQVIWPYVVFMFTSLIFVASVLVGFIALTVGEFGILAISNLLVGLICLNFGRTYYIKKVQ